MNVTTTIRTVISALLLTMAMACTQNQGYIGRLFGSWYLYDMTIDDVTPESFGDMEIFFSFQSSLIQITFVEPYHITQKNYGTWNEDDDFLYVDFSNGVKGRITALGWPDDKEVALEYCKATNDAMTLKYIADDGRVYIYYLRKTY